MINYCCSRCGKKVPVDYSHRVDLTDLNIMQVFKPKKSYILCLSCSVDLESWMEEDNKEENKNEHN